MNVTLRCYNLYVAKEFSSTKTLAFLQASGVTLYCGLVVFYKPYRLFFDGKKKESVDLVLYTAGWLFAFFLIFLFFAAFTRGS